MPKWKRIIIAFATAFMSPFAPAANTDAGMWRYAHRAWTPENSALRSIVRAVAQTTDGYLWLGTDTGLIRFDGVQMFPWTPPHGQELPGATVWALLGARDGSLWIGTTGGLASWKNGQLTQYSALSGFFVSNLLEDGEGNLWAAGGWGDNSQKGRLCAIRNGAATCYGDDGSLGDGISSLYEDAAGGLWVVAATGLWHWNPGPPVRYTAANQQLFTKRENSSTLVFAEGGNIRQIAGGKITDYPLPGAPSHLDASRILRDRHGGLWIGTAHGLLYSYQDRTRLITHSDGLSSSLVQQLFEDHEGTIWVCTSGGLDSFRELPLASLSTAEGLSSSAIRGVLAASDGSIWIGTADGLDRWKDGRMTIYRTRTDPGLPGDGIGTLFEDERGRIWVEAFTGVAILEAGKFRRVPSVPSGTLTSVASDYHGGLWFHTLMNQGDYGLVHFVNGKVIENVPWADLGGGPGAGLVVDPDGGVWTGLFNGRLAYFHAGQIRKLQLSGADKGGRRVFNISRGRDGALWVAGERGLMRLSNERVSTLTTENGLPCNVVHWIVEDDISSYWLLTACGLLRIGRRDLDAWTADPKHKIQPTVFDSADGVQSVSLLGPWRPHVTKSPDGRLWFVNGDNVSVIDPSNVVANTIPPPVHIEQITADGKTYYPAAGLHLPPRVRNLTIDYTALSLVVPERVHFRYKLEGQDPDWREVINDREVQYSNLPPRDYRFRVIATNDRGLWNETGDVVDFSIAPAYYQSHWFHAAVAVCCYALLFVLYRRRLRRLAHEYNLRLEERVEERARIARDLHDTLLQTFQGLMLRFQVVDELLPPGRAKDELQSTLDCGDQAVIEARNAVHDLRSSATTSNDLANALHTLGDELASNGSATFRLVVEGAARDLHPIVRDEIYRIAREALRNAVAHAAAHHIEAEIFYGDHLIRLRFRDDGKGIPAEVLERGRDGHYGLAGMRERARSIGAKLTISSGLGIGTDIDLTIPGPIAYGTPSARSRLQRFWRVAG